MAGPHVIPEDYKGGNGTHNLFCYAALVDNIKGALYTDTTRALPVRSLNGHQYYFVTYNDDTNYIFAIPI